MENVAYHLECHLLSYFPEEHSQQLDAERVKQKRRLCKNLMNTIFPAFDRKRTV